LKIVHVVTYISEDGAFGGPVTVASEQARALAAAGHDVTILAGAPAARSYDENGVSYRLFKARPVLPRSGFALVAAPNLWRAAFRARKSWDVAHMHLARDLVMLPTARVFRAFGVPMVTQTHGMVRARSDWTARILDAVFTRPILHKSAQVFALTDDEVEQLRKVAPRSNVSRIKNGVRVEASPVEDRKERVLFLARLHSRKRPQSFVEMAQILAPKFPRHEFVLAGADEGELVAVKAAIAASGLDAQISWVGAVPPSEVGQLMASAAVYVLPSVNEVFPMTILEAFQAETPVVTTSSLGMADLCEKFEAALITDGSPRGLAIAVERLLVDADLRVRLKAGGLRLVRDELNITAVARQLADAYRAAQSRDIRIRNRKEVQ